MIYIGIGLLLVIVLGTIVLVGMYLELQRVHESVNGNLEAAQEKLNTALVKIEVLESQLRKLTE